ncbi:MAG TPA: hypothetical protein VGB87_24300, partial [Vicinamibacteria bacterium]
MPRRVAVLVLLAAALATTLRAAGPQFWRLEGTRAFLDGEIAGLSLDSEGRLRLGTAPRSLFDPEAPNAWCVARDRAGALYVGTGNDGRVVRFDGGKGTILFDADELEVHAVAAAPDGRVFAATSPDGAVYAISPDGKAARFFDPEERYIWALAADPSGVLYVATGDVAGRVHRVTPDGKSEVALAVTDTHVLSLALDARGRVYAGTAPEGLVYRVDRPGKGFVLLDSAYREIKALDVAPDGTLYAAAIDGRTTDAAARPAPAAPAAPAAPTTGGVVAEVTVSESFSVVAPPAAATSATGPAGEAAPGPPKGALLRFRPSGEIDTLWSSPDDVPHAIVLSGPDVLVGTGDKGKVYRVGPDSRWALVATLPAEQVTALAPAEGGGALAVTANPARLLALDGTAATEGTFESRVKDTDTVSGWGRVSWEGITPPGTAVRIQTRSGNTATPDATWSDWSPPATQSAGEPIRSERARFLQLRVSLAGTAGASPTVAAVTAAYLQRNL